MAVRARYSGPLADRIRGKMRRRADCQDLIARALAEIDGLTEQIDRDLEELAERIDADRPGRMA